MCIRDSTYIWVVFSGAAERERSPRYDERRRLGTLFINPLTLFLDFGQNFSGKPTEFQVFAFLPIFFFTNFSSSYLYVGYAIVDNSPTDLGTHKNSELRKTGKLTYPIV